LPAATKAASARHCAGGKPHTRPWMNLRRRTRCGHEDALRRARPSRPSKLRTKARGGAPPDEGVAGARRVRHARGGPCPAPDEVVRPRAAVLLPAIQQMSTFSKYDSENVNTNA